MVGALIVVLSENGRQPLEIHHYRRQIRLNGHIPQPAARSPTQPVLRFCFTMYPLDPPAVSCVQGFSALIALNMLASGSQQRFIAGNNQNRAASGIFTEAALP